MRTVIIVYEHFVSSTAHLAKGVWSGYFEDTGEGFDYDTKSGLIKSCIESGYHYKVMRSHRDGTRSVLEHRYLKPRQ